jgi:hypothetical protein
MGMKLGPTLTAEQEFKREIIARIEYWENREDGKEFAEYYKSILRGLLNKKK